MYLITLLALLVVVAADMYDNFNFEAAMKNERLLHSYFQCIMDRGRCTPRGLEIKRRLPNILETQCSKCTNRQKQIWIKLMDFLRVNHEDWYAELEAKYDPKASYRNQAKKITLTKLY